MFRNSTLFAILLLLAVFSTVLYMGRQQETANKDVVAYGEQYAREAFLAFEHVASSPVVDAGEPVQLPRLTWRGANAKVHAVLFSGPTPRPSFQNEWTVLAQTPNGRFFAVKYAPALMEIGTVRGAARLAAQEFEQLTEAQMKQRLFEAGLFDAYRTLFGEPPTKEARA